MILTHHAGVRAKELGLCLNGKIKPMISSPEVMIEKLWNESITYTLPIGQFKYKISNHGVDQIDLEYKYNMSKRILFTYKKLKNDDLIITITKNPEIRSIILSRLGNKHSA